jgi:F0F1-type ATP synthase alpha subunit
VIREIVTPTNTNFTLKIPKEYLNRQVEILVLPLFNENKVKKTKTLEVFSKTAGILKNKKIDPLKWQREIRSDRKI